MLDSQTYAFFGKQANLRVFQTLQDSGKEWLPELVHQTKILRIYYLSSCINISGLG
jgi:hypothetical protein